jgi:hypothetical protein
MFGVSIGGIVSSTASGWLLDRLGTDAPFLIGGGGGVLLGLLAPWILPAVPLSREAEG